MPIHERDPWRLQYFAGVVCPADVFIPTDDADAYRWNPRHRGVYNKLLVAESQGLACAPHGVEPAHYPVFSKPIYNIEGMGVGGRTLHDRGDYLRHCRPGSMWTTLLEGEHVSSDFAVIDGDMRWARHTIGLAGPGGTFDYWTCEARRLPALEAYCAAWIGANLQGYTGMLNLESIGGRVIEAHLRFADQWPDLYGAGWLDAMVRVYSHGVWEYADADRRTGYSVILFAPHRRQYAYPPEEVAAKIRAAAAVSSLQFTFHEQRAAETHAMPPGGFRLAVINVWDLAEGLRVRRDLAHAFGIDAPAGSPPAGSP